MYIHAYQSYMWNILAEKEANKKKHCEKIPIIGFGTNCSGDIKNLLEKEGINIRDFIIKQIPELTQEGSDRSLFTEVAGLDIKKEKDGYKIKFKLKKGVYATEVIKQMFT
jgi:tRNA pseudouridine13 synthase